MAEAGDELRAAHYELDALCRKRRDWGLSRFEQWKYVELCELEQLLLVQGLHHRPLDPAIDISGWG